MWEYIHKRQISSKIGTCFYCGAKLVRKKTITKESEIRIKDDSELESKKIEYIEKNTSFLKEIRNATQILVMEEAGYRPDKANEIMGITEQRRKEYLGRAHELYPHYKDLDLFKETREKILRII